MFGHWFGHFICEAKLSSTNVVFNRNHYLYVQPVWFEGIWNYSRTMDKAQLVFWDIFCLVVPPLCEHAEEPRAEMIVGYHQRLTLNYFQEQLPVTHRLKSLLALWACSLTKTILLHFDQAMHDGFFVMYLQCSK